MEEIIKQVTNLNEIDNIDNEVSFMQREKSQSRKQVLIFEIDEKLFGIDIMDINEILETQPIRKLPNARPYLEGLLNMRGDIIPVINLKKRLEIENITLEQLSHYADQVDEDKKGTDKSGKQEENKKEENIDENSGNNQEDKDNEQAGNPDDSMQIGMHVGEENEQNILVCNIKEGNAGIIVDRIVKVKYLNEDQYEPVPKLLSSIGEQFVKGFIKIENSVIVMLDVENLFTVNSK